MSKPIHVTQTDFDSHILQATQPVVVDFWAEWCGPCRRLAPVIDQLAQDYAGRLQFAKVNVDADGELAATYQVEGIPTSIVFVGGQEIRRFVGYMTREQFARQLETLPQVVA